MAKGIVPGELLKPVRPHLGELRLWHANQKGAELSIGCSFYSCMFCVTFGRGEGDEAVEMLLQHYLDEHPHVIEETG